MDVPIPFPFFSICTIFSLHTPPAYFLCFSPSTLLHSPPCTSTRSAWRTCDRKYQLDWIFGFTVLPCMCVDRCKWWLEILKWSSVMLYPVIYSFIRKKKKRRVLVVSGNFMTSGRVWVHGDKHYFWPVYKTFIGIFPQSSPLQVPSLIFSCPWA